MRHWLFNSVTGLTLLCNGLLTPEEIQAMPSVQHLKLLCKHPGILALENDASFATKATMLSANDLQDYLKQQQFKATTAPHYVSI